MVPFRQFLCNESNGQRCLASMDSDLEAFSRNPADGSFAVIAFQLAAFTKYLNEVFLSYLVSNKNSAKLKGKTNREMQEEHQWIVGEETSQSAH